MFETATPVSAASRCCVNPAAWRRRCRFWPRNSLLVILVSSSPWCGELSLSALDGSASIMAQLQLVGFSPIQRKECNKSIDVVSRLTYNDHGRGKCYNEQS